MAKRTPKANNMLIFVKPALLADQPSALLV